MSFEQTRDVIDRARAFHRDLRDFYRRLEDVAVKERVRILLDYLSRHEQVMEGRLAECEATHDRGVLNTWFKYTPPPIREEIGKFVIRPDMSAEAVIRMALQFDETLLRLYAHAADLAPTPEVKDLFQQLHDEGRKERAKLVRDAFEPE
jgi:rubrerythrin